MTADAQKTLEQWRNSRVRQANVAGIDIQFRIIPANLLLSAGEELQTGLDEITMLQTQRILLDEGDHLPEPGSPIPTRREFAKAMRKVLNLVLPQILLAPDWLPQAMDEFSENEIIELFNAIMHGTGETVSMPPYWQV
ncbi:MAG: hypothetical protein OXF44_01445 [Anaerolineaceae bacterium]|nr:hypothetical protein [Anaerolineaceae bacterium]